MHSVYTQWHRCTNRNIIHFSVLDRSVHAYAFVHPRWMEFARNATNLPRTSNVTDVNPRTWTLPTLWRSRLNWKRVSLSSSGSLWTSGPNPPRIQFSVFATVMAFLIMHCMSDPLAEDSTPPAYACEKLELAKVRWKSRTMSNMCTCGETNACCSLFWFSTH